MELKDIKKRFGVGDIRAKRIQRYFKAHPGEAKQVRHYNVVTTTDYQYLQRNVGGFKNKYRRGCVIGTDTFGPHAAATKYLVRVVKTK